MHDCQICNPLRVVTLGDGRRVTLGNYVKAWRYALAAPAGTVFKGRPTDPRVSATREEIIHDFRDGLHDRINRHIPGYGKGRKWSDDWQRATGHAARLVNMPRVIVRMGSIPYWLLGRLRHRLEL